MKKNKLTYFYFLIYFIIALVCIKKFLFTDGVIGYRHDWDIFFYCLGFLKENILSIWKPQGLGYFNAYDPSYLLRLFLSSLKFLHFSSSLYSKLIIVIFLSISGISLYKLASSYLKSNLAAFAGGLFYMLTPVVFNNFVAGYIWFLVAYAISPLIIFIFLKTLSTTNKLIFYRNIIVCGILFALAISQIHFLFFLSLFFIIYLFLFPQRIKTLKVILLIWLIGFLLHLTWILPLLINFGSMNSTIQSATTLAWNKTMSGEIGSAYFLTLFYGERYIYSTIKNNNLWNICSLIIIILVFLAPVLKPKKITFYFVLIAIIGLFFSKGLNPPAEKISTWLYNLPYFSTVFRQSYHWMAIVALSYAVLFSITIDFLISWFKNKKIYFLKYFLIIMIFLLMFIYSKPFFTGDFSGELESFKPQTAYNDLYNRFKNNLEDFRVMWLPAIGPVKQNEMKYSINFDPLINYFPKKSFSSEGGVLFFEGNSTIFRNFILCQLYNNVSISNLGKILSLANVEYIFNRADYQTLYPDISNLGSFTSLKEKWTQNLEKILEIEKGIQKETSSAPIEIYQNLENKPHIYSAQKILLTSNNLSVLQSNKINDFDAFIFTDQLDGNISNITLDKDIDRLSLASALSDKKYQIKSATYANKYFDAHDGWILGKYWFWYKPIFASELGEFIFTLKSDDININFRADESGEYKIIGKYYLDKAARLKIQIDGNQPIQLTNKNLDQFSWAEIGEAKITQGNHKINISTDTGNAALGQLMIIPKDLWSKLLEQADNLISQNITTPAQDSELKYKKINLSKYEITANNNPFYLIFSENYNPGWVIKDSSGKKQKYSHFIVNGYANAFYINPSAGQKLYLEFEPQKYYLISFVISLVFFAGLIITALILSFCQD